jgi:hypothetical protein
MNTGVNFRDGHGAKTQILLPACQSCDAFARRADARFCAACGQQLTTDYYPADALRASYRQIQTPFAPHQPQPLPGRRSPRRDNTLQVKKIDERAHAVSCPSLAFATYALVPYLGIIFCLPAIIIGCAGLINASYNVGNNRGHAFYAATRRRRDSLAGIMLGVMILVMQLFLWWLLQKIPDWVQP